MNDVEDMEQARRIRQHLLDGHDADVSTLVTEAAYVFKHCGMAPQVRWLDLERDGYGKAEARGLAHYLGLGSEHRLVVYIGCYRTQRGFGASRRIPHFFVEPVDRLVEARSLSRAMARTVSTPLDAPPFALRVTRDGERIRFEPSTFELIVLGLRAALYLQLGLIEA